SRPPERRGNGPAGQGSDGVGATGSGQPASLSQRVFRGAATTGCHSQGLDPRSRITGAGRTHFGSGPLGAKGNYRSAQRSTEGTSAQLYFCQSRPERSAGAKPPYYYHARWGGC